MQGSDQLKCSFCLGNLYSVVCLMQGSDQLKRSFSFGDLSMDENQMMRLKRLGSTASLDSVDEMDSAAEDEMYIHII